MKHLFYTKMWIFILIAATSKKQNINSLLIVLSPNADELSISKN